MKALIILSALASLTLTACDTPKTAAEAAKRQRYTAIGDRLLVIGVNAGVLTPAEATDIRDIGALAVPTNAPTVIETTSGK